MLKPLASILILLFIQAVFSISQAPTISVTPSVLSKSRETVTVTWTNPNPTPYDRITVHSPANQSTFIGYIYVNPFPNWEKGFGNWELPLVNNRHNYGFRLWSNATGTEVLVAVSNNVTFENPNEPLQGHLQLTSQPTEMRIMWVSGTEEGALVYFGTDPNSLFPNTVPVNTSTYSTAQLCDAPANLSTHFLNPGWIHDALLTGLSLNTKYYYKFGSDEDGWSKLYSFMSSPGVGAETKLEFFVYGDLGVSFPFYIEQDQQPPAAETTHWINKFLTTELESSPSLVLHIGDISYARGLAFIWDWFFEEIESISTRVPYMVAIGNHEYDYPQQPFLPSWSDYNTDSGGECGTPYYSRFHTPSPIYTSLLNYSNVYPRNLWYSFEMGPVHFTLLSTETDFLVGSEQYEFIAKDLASVDRSKTPWLVFAGHRPMYTTSQHHGEQALENHMRDAYEPLFKEYGVDICFWGHVHTYERTCPMYNYTCVEKGESGPVHIVVGNAGNIYQTSWIATPTDSNYHLQPEWDIFRTENYGFGRVKANSTHFEFTLISDNQGNVHDRVVLLRD